MWDIEREPCQADTYRLFFHEDVRKLKELIELEDAWITGSFTDSLCKVHCESQGLQYWMIRAVDSAGNVSDISNIIPLIIDTEAPTPVQHFEIDIMDN